MDQHPHPIYQAIINHLKQQGITDISHFSDRYNTHYIIIHNRTQNGTHDNHIILINQHTTRYQGAIGSVKLTINHNDPQLLQIITQHAKTAKP